jgi:hypothetical protein
MLNSFGKVLKESLKQFEELLQFKQIKKRFLRTGKNRFLTRIIKLLLHKLTVCFDLNVIAQHRRRELWSNLEIRTLDGSGKLEA